MSTRLFISHLAGCAALATALPLAIQPAKALDPSGTALAVIQAVNASGPGGARVLEAQRPVYSGDRIKTGAIGQAQIRFRDDTRLVVSPNSSVVIDKFVYSSDRTAASVTMNVTKGAFRFISGNSRSRAYSIRTPSATIGVRGTQFDVSVSRAGTGLLVYQGSVRMCGRTGRCIVVSDACGAAFAAPDGTVGRPGTSSARSARIRNQFPLAVNQGFLRGDFRVSTAACGDIGTPSSPGQNSNEAREARASDNSGTPDSKGDGNGDGNGGYEGGGGGHGNGY